MNINDIINKLSNDTGKSIAYIARAINQSPQNFNNKLKRGTLSLDEFEQIAKALNIEFKASFILPNKEEVQINDPNIKDEDTLEFAIFCIEKLKDEMKINGKDAYSLLTKETDILYQYIVKNYDVLHTQDEKYIVNDIRNVLSLKHGVTI